MHPDATPTADFPVGPIRGAASPCQHLLLRAHAGVTVATGASGLSMNVCDPLGSPNTWDRELQSYPAASVFHTAAWARVLVRTYGHKPFYLRFCHEMAAPALVPLMEVQSPITGRRGVCLPFSDLCAPLLPGSIGLHMLRPALEQVARDHRWKHLELRGGSPPAGGPDSSPPTFLGHHLDIGPGADVLWQQLAGSVRRAIRKAEGHGLHVRIDHDEKAVRSFYSIHARTRRRHGLPPQPFDFFRNLHLERLIGPDSGFVVTAGWRGNPVAAAVFLRYEKSFIYKFGASDESVWKSRPNNLVMWEGIRHLAAAGARSLHFGRTSIGQEGLRRFKLSWGAEEEAISYCKYHTHASAWQEVNANSARRLTRSIFRLMPLSLNRLAGRLLYPHLD